VQKWQTKIIDAVGDLKTTKLVTVYHAGPVGLVENCKTGSFMAGYHSNIAVYAHSSTIIGFGVGPKRKTDTKEENRIFPAYEEIEFTGEHPYFKSLVVLNGQLQYDDPVEKGLKHCLYHKPMLSMTYDWINRPGDPCYLHLGRKKTEECKNLLDYDKEETMPEFRKFESIQGKFDIPFPIF